MFRYVTSRTMFASLTSLFLCVLLGPWLIRKLREFQIGQHIREDGPKSHQKKAGTPTMGGVLIIISIIGPDAAVGGPAASLCLDRAVRAACLRRHRIHRRLREGDEQAQSGADGEAEVRTADAGGGA